MESIISKVRRFKKIYDDDSQSLIKFVDVVERWFRDLKKLGLEIELCNANVMSIIESKLPRSIGLEWYRRLHTKGEGIGRDNKFQRLLEYLQVEKNALEYSLSDVRNGPDRFTRDCGYQSNQFEETLYC